VAGVGRYFSTRSVQGEDALSWKSLVRIADSTITHMMTNLLTAGDEPHDPHGSQSQILCARLKNVHFKEAIDGRGGLTFLGYGFEGTARLVPLHTGIGSRVEPEYPTTIVAHKQK